MDNKLFDKYFLHETSSELSSSKTLKPKYLIFSDVLKRGNVKKNLTERDLKKIAKKVKKGLNENRQRIL